MKVQRRLCDSKRHTVGYKVSGQWRTRNEATKLAKAGRIDGVTVYRRGRNHYIQSLPGHRNLYDLPITIEA